jgi:DNA-binding transcriptional ArsR family regulator
MKARTENVAPRRPRPMTGEALELVAACFKAMSEPLRLRILQELEHGDRSVSALAQRVGSTQPNVSKHLKVLQDAGMLIRRQQGNTAFYSIADAMVFELCDMICSRLRDRLEAQIGALNARMRA